MTATNEKINLNQSRSQIKIIVHKIQQFNLRTQFFRYFISIIIN